MRKSPRLICIIGTDGSGKTTLSDAFAAACNAEGLKVARAWLGAESVIMRPLRGVLRLFWKRPAKAAKSPEPGYRTEVKSKARLAGRWPLLTRAYVWLVLADYHLQLAFKLRRLRGQDMVVADRYLFDVAVNLAVTLGWSEDQLVDFLSRRLGSVPWPDLLVYVAVPPEVSMSRKDDIPDIDYLKLRMGYYGAIARAFGFRLLDGTEPIAANVERLRDLSAAAQQRRRVHYVHSNNVDVGGADFVLANMAREMRDLRPLGYDVCVSLRVPSRIVQRYREWGIPAHLHPFPRPQLSRGALAALVQMLTWPAGLAYFHRLFGKTRPDIVHVNDLYDFLPALAARMRKIPVVYHLRMIRVRRAEQRLFGRLVAALGDASVSVSDAVRRTYFASDQVGRHRALVIHDLGAPALVAERPRGERPPGLASQGLTVVMVGRIESWKGQHVFLDAVERLGAAPGASFYLVGGGVPGSEDYHRQIVERAARLGVVCLGERTDVPDILRWADISVHASTSPDPFPGVVIESLLAETATVASAAGGVLEMIEDGVNGLLYPPGDGAALAERLHALLSEADPRGRYGPAGRRKALSLVDAASVNAQVDALYRSLQPTGPA